MSIEQTIEIDETTALEDGGDRLLVVQLVEGTEPQVIHLTPKTAVALAAAIMSRLNA